MTSFSDLALLFSSLPKAIMKGSSTRRDRQREGKKDGHLSVCLCEFHYALVQFEWLRPSVCCLFVFVCVWLSRVKLDPAAERANYRKSIEPDR
mmetsp:Transcript_30477/g.59885  ORF Transcript_30477/g.59885 Transcript_30477/m.59885 type:complete len:93 (+) Transcript_30477:55-333(+)